MFKTIKTAELTGAALDWAVAKCEGNRVAKHSTGRMYLVDTPWADKSRIKWIAEYSPSRHWSQGGPIIEREKLSVGTRYTNDQIYHDVDVLCWARNAIGGFLKYGPTPLIAAMRCYVASKMGDVVEIPEELI